MDASLHKGRRGWWDLNPHSSQEHVSALESFPPPQLMNKSDLWEWTSHKKSYSRLAASSGCSWQPGDGDVLLIIHIYKSASADFRGNQIGRSGPILLKKNTKQTRKLLFLSLQLPWMSWILSDKQSWLDASALYSSSLLTSNSITTGDLCSNEAGWSQRNSCLQVI